MVMVEVAYAKRSTTLSGVAGNALAVTPIPFDTGEQCLVPRQRRPCYLIGSAIIVAETPSAGETCELAIGLADPAPGNIGGLLPLDLVLTSSHGNALASGERQWCLYRIPPDTPGARYQLYATVTDGDFTVLAPAHSPAFLLAVI